MATYRYTSYRSYGETLASTGTLSNPYRFGGSYGAYTDVSTGLLKLGQRFYDPALGRWTQQDPLLNLQDPQQWNRYGYVASNPVNFIDPPGLACTGGSDLAAPAAALIGSFALIGLGVLAFPPTGGLTAPLVYQAAGLGLAAGTSLYAFTQCTQQLGM